MEDGNESPFEELTLLGTGKRFQSWSCATKLQGRKWSILKLLSKILSFEYMHHKVLFLISK